MAELPKRRKCTGKFQKEWLKQFGGMIVPCKAGEQYARCSVCSRDIKVAASGLYDVKEHLKSRLHADNFKRHEEGGAVRAFFRPQAQCNAAKDVTRAEVLFSYFIAEHNLPASVSDHFTDLTRAMFPDSGIAKKFRDNDDGNTFEQLEYPPRLASPIHDSASNSRRRTHCSCLNAAVFARLFDEDGRLVNEHKLRQAVFAGGVDPVIRKSVWLLLFGFYPFLSTKREHKVIHDDYNAKYHALKRKWRNLLAKDEVTATLATAPYCTPECPRDVAISSPTIESDRRQFADIQAQVYAARQPDDLKSLLAAVRIIDKDVPRTDRTSEYFSADMSHLLSLRESLITYACCHPHVGYAQGMNDVMARFLMVLDSEVEAYWCFTHYMATIETEFMEHGVLCKLELVHHLLLELDPDLMQYLQYMEVSDMAFCHRWMLLNFKREFPLDVSIRCFEILSSHHLELSSMTAHRTREATRKSDFEKQGGKNRIEESPQTVNYTFDVFMCVSILMAHRLQMFKCRDAAEIFEFICSLTNKLDLDDLLDSSERLFYKYCKKSVADCFQLVEIPSPTAVTRTSTGKYHTKS